MRALSAKTVPETRLLASPHGWPTVARPTHHHYECDIISRRLRLPHVSRVHGARYYNVVRRAGRAASVILRRPARRKIHTGIGSSRFQNVFCANACRARRPRYDRGAAAARVPLRVASPRARRARPGSLSSDRTRTARYIWYGSCSRATSVRRRILAYQSRIQPPPRPRPPRRRFLTIGFNFYSTHNTVI